MLYAESWYRLGDYSKADSLFEVLITEDPENYLVLNNFSYYLAERGEKLEELIIDWYFVPIRHYYKPEEIRGFLEERGLVIEKYLPASGRFDSTSNFIFKARKFPQDEDRLQPQEKI